jgi:aminomethyltransferase
MAYTSRYNNRLIKVDGWRMIIKQTPLQAAHLAAGAKLVDFAGWHMPLHYGSQLQEHQQVRQDAGMFDVSHMTIVDIVGQQAKAFLQYLLANDVGRLTTPGKALYSCMLNQQGRVVDDLLAYFMTPTYYRLIVNAATHDSDLAWLTQHASAFAVTVQEQTELAMVAVQGPNARAKVASVLPAALAARCNELKSFHCVAQDEWFIARTGYTGEDGLEIALPAAEAMAFWQALLAAGVAPCGLGARDSLRLEAGLNLYGSDMDLSTTPLESNLAWTVAWEPVAREFIGRTALQQLQQAGSQRQLVGLVLVAKGGVLRAGQIVKVNTQGEGVITSGGFSPSLQCSIALARLPVVEAQAAEVIIRDKSLPVRIVKPPFVRHGKSLID